MEATNDLCLPLTALENSDNVIDSCGWVLIILSIVFMIATLPISIWMCIKVGCCSHSVSAPPLAKNVNNA